MKLLLWLIALTYLMSACKATQITTTENSKYFQVQIIQNGKAIPSINNIITLKKRPFQFKVRFQEEQVLYWSASWGKHYYNYPSNKNSFECVDKNKYEECRFLASKIGSQMSYNEDKDIYVGNKSYHFTWGYYGEIYPHFMDKDLNIQDGWINATVTVEKIFDLDKRDTEQYDESDYYYPIDKNNRDIYIMMAMKHDDTTLEYPQEIQRQKFILRFE